MRHLVTFSVMAVLALGSAAHAEDAYGSLNGFDVVNNTGEPAYGFEIEADDVLSNDVTYTYDWNRYGTPVISEDQSDPDTPRVNIRYETDSGRTAYTETPVGALAPTDGHLFIDPLVNFGGEHFGVGFSTAPSAVRCYWLVDDGAGSLMRGPQVNIATPTFYLLDGSDVVAVAEPASPVGDPLVEYGAATWVKVTRTSAVNNNSVGSSDLVSDNPDDAADANWANGEATEVEVEWALFQTQYSAADGGANGVLVGDTDTLWNGDEVITRRYDFFEYAGPVDADTGQALADGVAEDGIHGVGGLAGVEVVGAYIGAQMAAFDSAPDLGLIDNLQAGVLNEAYPFRAVVIGGATPVSTTHEGSLPPGMSFDDPSGFLYGTPTVAGWFALKVDAADANADSVSNTYTLEVVDPSVISSTIPSRDVVAPDVLSVTRDEATPNRSVDVDYTVTFSESVIGVDLTDFNLTTSGVAGAFVSAVTGTDDTRTVTVSTGTGDGTIRLNVLDDGTIVDLAANALSGPFITGETYTIDKTRPATTITSVPINPTGMDPVAVTVTFSESVTGFVEGDLNVAAADITSFAGSGDTYTFTMTPNTSGTTATVFVGGNRANDSAGNSNTKSNTLSILEIVPPSVSSITRAQASPSRGATVKFTVTFDESVVGVDTTDFTIATTGVSGAAISSISGSGALRTVTVGTGTGDGTIRLDLIDDGTIDDLAGNDLTGAFSSGETFTIDKTRPTVTLTSDPVSPTGTDPADITVQFSESVNGFVEGDLTLSGGTVSAFTAVDGDTYTFTLTPDAAGTSAVVSVGANRAKDDALNANFASNTITILETVAPSVVSSTRVTSSPSRGSVVKFSVAFSESVVGVDTSDFTLTTSGVTGASVSSVAGGGATRTVSVATGSGDGTIRLDVLDDGTIDDLAGNNLDAGFTSGEEYTMDKTRPSVTLTSDPVSPTGTDPADITVQFSEVVTGFVEGDLTVTGGTVSAFTAVDGDTYTFTLTPDGAGISATVRVGANRAKDTAGNASLASNTITITETVAPTVVSSTRVTASPTRGGSVKFDVTFSESVVGVDTSDFDLTVTGVTGAAISGISGSGSTRTVTVSSGTGDGTIRLDVLDDGTIDDLAGNNLDAAFSSGEEYTIDKTRPTVTLTSVPPSPTGTDPVAVTAQFSESVNDFVEADLTLTAASVSAFTAVDGDTYTFTLTPTTAGTSAKVFIGSNRAKDDALNANQPSNTLIVVEDVSPTVASVTRLFPDPTKKTVVKFRVTFDEGVTGVDLTDFDLTTTGVTGAAIASIAGSGSGYTLRVNTGTGDGTIKLNVLDDGSIDDNNGNPLAGPFSSGETYTVDKTRPTVVLTSDPVSPSGTDPVDITVTFSENMTGFVEGDVTVTNCTISAFSGADDVYTFTVTPDGPGLLATVKVAAGKAKDPANNTNTSSNTITITENVAPTVLSSTRINSNPTRGATVKFLVTFDENVTGVDTTDFALVTTGVSGAAVTAVSGAGDDYTVTASSGTGDGTIELQVLDDDTILDLSGNPLNGGFTAGEVYDIDKTKPTVVMTTVPENPTGTDPVAVTVTFSEPVTGFIQSDVALTNASISDFTGVDDVYTFTLTPTVAGITATASIGGGRAKDAANNTNTASNTVSVLELVAPSVVSSVRTYTNPTKRATVRFTVTFSEDVVGVDATDFALTTTGVTGAGLSSVTGSGDQYTVNVSSGTGDGTIRLDVLDDGTIDDESGNALTGAFTGGETYDVDKTKPTVVLSSVPENPTGTDPVAVTVTFSENVTGFVESDLSVSGGTISSFTGADDVYTFTITPDAAGISASVSVPQGKAADAAGNTNVASNTITALEEVAPSIVSVVRLDSDPSKLNTVDYRVTFSEDVVGVDTTDFVLVTTGGIADAFVNSVTGSGDTRNVAVRSGTGDGTIRMDVLDDGTIDDLAGNNLDAGFTSGEVYTIDKTRPTVTLTSVAPDPTTIDPFVVTVTFSENVTGFVEGDLSVTNGTVSGFSGADDVYTFTFTPDSIGVTVTAKVNGGRAADSANNTNTTSNTLSRDIQ